MSLETRTEETAPSAPQHRGRPVVVYIMILFIAAFLLMALSFAAHQRSNEQALGDLETSVHATLKDLQAEQARLPELEAENAILKNQLTESQQRLEQVSAALGDAALSLEDAASSLAETERRLRAMEQLYCLQQWFERGNYAACEEQLEAMEQNGLAAALPDEAYPHDNGVTPSPASHFLEIKEAVAAAMAETSAE